MPHNRAYTTTGYKRRQYEDVARIIGTRMYHATTTIDDEQNRAATFRELAAIQNAFEALFAADNDRFDTKRFDAAVADYAEGRR